MVTDSEEDLFDRVTSRWNLDRRKPTKNWTKTFWEDSTKTDEKLKKNCYRRRLKKN